MAASGPATLPPALTIPALTKLNAGSEAHIPAHVKDRDEMRALWEYLGGTGRLTSAGLQAAVDTYDKVKLGSIGTIQLSTTVTWPTGTSFEGDGDMATIIEWIGPPGDPTDPAETDGIMFLHTGPVPPSDPVYSHATFKGIGFRSGVAGVTAIKSYYGGIETYENLAFYGIARPLHIEGGFAPALRRIMTFPYGSNGCGGSWFSKLPHIEISGYATNGNSNAESVMTFRSVAAGAVGHLNFYSPRNIGVILEGDTQGLDFVNGVMTAVTDGVLIRQGGIVTIPATGSPQYNDFVGFNIDQPSVSGARILQGGMSDFVKFNVTNSLNSSGGIAAPGAGSAWAIILGNPVDAFNIGIFNSQFENLGPGCIYATAGAKNLRIGGCRMIRGNNSPVGDAGILIAGGTSNDIQIFNNNIQNMTHSIVDQSSGARREYLDNIHAEYPLITTPTGVTIRDRNTWVVDGVTLVGANPVVSGTLTANALAANSAVIAGATTITGVVTVRSGNAVAWNNAANTAVGQIAANAAGDLVVGGTTGKLTANGTLTGNAVVSTTSVTAASAVIAGALGSATAAITAASAAISAALTAASVTATGAVSGATVAATGALSGASAAITNGVTAASATLTGAIAAATANFGATASGFGIVQRIRRRDAGSPIAVLGFGVTSAAETDVVKGAIGMKRLGGQGTGSMIFMLDNNADTNDVDETDAKAILLGIPTAGAQVAAHWIQPYFDNSPPADADMPASTICWYVNETGGLLRAKIKKKGGTIVNLTTGLPVA